MDHSEKKIFLKIRKIFFGIFPKKNPKQTEQAVGTLEVIFYDYFSMNSLSTLNPGEHFRIMVIPNLSGAREQSD